MEVVIGFVRYVFAMNIEHTVTAEKVPDTIQNELAILFSQKQQNLSFGVMERLKAQT
jgi:hypothetical protein